MDLDYFLLRVISRHQGPLPAMSASPPKADIETLEFGAVPALDPNL
jgi:hypothetical protein